MMKFELKTLDDYSDESLLTEIRRVADSLKGERLTVLKFDQYSKVHSSTLRKRFGTWQNALGLAGISKEIAPRVKLLTKDILIERLNREIGLIEKTLIYTYLIKRDSSIPDWAID